LNELFDRIKNKKRILIGITVLFLVFTIPAVFVVDDFVQNFILIPIAYYVWLGNIIIKALPESCFLTLLIVLSLLLIVPSLRRGRRPIWRPRPAQTKVEGEVTIWEQRLQLLIKGSYTENRFAYHLGHLVLNILSYEERLPIRSVIHNLENGAFNMPNKVRNYILSGIGMGQIQRRFSLILRFQYWWKRMFHANKTALSTEQYEDMFATINYIESKLQIPDSGEPDSQ
jgi:hypothetical protein